VEDNTKVNEMKNLTDIYEKFRLHNALTLECVKILPWELDVASMKIENIFGMNILFSEKSDRVDFKLWLNMIHPEDVIQVLTPVQMIMEGSTDEISIEYRLNKNSGEYLWVKTIANQSGYHRDQTSRNPEFKKRKKNY